MQGSLLIGYIGVEGSKGGLICLALSFSVFLQSSYNLAVFLQFTTSIKYTRQTVGQYYPYYLGISISLNTFLYDNFKSFV